MFGDHEDRPDPAKLEKTRITVAGLKKGTKIRVLFEDRELVAEDGFFVDDLRGVDLYQRYGGERSGYGNAPVALHAYELPSRDAAWWEGVGRPTSNSLAFDIIVIFLACALMLELLTGALPAEQFEDGS